MNRLQIFGLIAMALFMAGIGCQNSDSRNAAEDRQYDIRGKVVTVDAASGKVTLDHEDIPGLMKAMTMEFTVQDPKLLVGLKAGDKVQGRLKKSATGHVVTHLEKRADQQESGKE